jgi:hypothetical protein
MTDRSIETANPLVGFVVLLAIWLLCTFLFSMAIVALLVAVISLWPNSFRFLSDHPGCAIAFVVSWGFMASTMYVVIKLITGR